MTAQAAGELGLKEGIPVAYRAGDQPNNALSLNVFNPGEIASTAGTSGVVYGVNGAVNYDPESRVNTFAHVNHTAEQTRLGVLLCINGTGILNSWMKRTVMSEEVSYAEMNGMAAQAADRFGRHQHSSVRKRGRAYAPKPRSGMFRSWRKLQLAYAQPFAPCSSGRNRVCVQIWN